MVRPVSPTVRAARPADWEVWRDLRLLALADAPDAFGEMHAEAAQRSEAEWRSQVAPRADATRLLACEGHRPVGMLVVALAATGERRAIVYAMWVAPDSRRHGAGRALVAKGLQWARAHAALEVGLRVSERQPAARAMYAACGFALTGDHEPLRPGSEVSSEAMRLRLPPLIMGVVNVTPDSFSDGGHYLRPSTAVAHGLALASAGADLLDVGGEATNPRATPVDAAEELRRILPVIEALAAAGLAVSIDTTKAQVARAAVWAGAVLVNDVSGGLFDPTMIETVRGLGVRYVAGHLRGTSLPEVFAAEEPVTWQTVAAELTERIVALPATQAWVDPGLGFGKGSDPGGNVSLLRHAGDIAATVGRPIVIGASRKRFVRRVAGLTDGASRDEVDAASTLATIAAVRAGAHVVRVHNVALLRTALTAYNKK